MATKPTKPKPPTVAQRRLVPRAFVGSEGVRGNWAKAPRVDASKWETGVNEFGSFFIRPRTEMTGLDPQAVADVRDFDALTARQGQRITGAYNDYAAAAAADRDAGAAALGNLANLAGAAYTPRTLGNPAPGGVMGPGVSAAEQMLPGILGLGQREQSFAQSAQTIAGMNTLPTVARSEGLGAVERFTGERQGQRAEFLKGLREIQSKQDAAAAEQAAEQAKWQRELAATLRGQNLDLLGQTLGQRTDLQQTLLSNQGNLAEAQLRADTSLAGIDARAQQKAISDQFRTPRQLKAAGYVGGWATKPKRPPAGITFEQASDTRWYGKAAGAGAGGAKGVDRNTQNRALADIQASLGQKIDARPQTKQEKETGTAPPQRSLSATEIAQDIASQYKVPLVWAYDQARRMGFHHRPGEWQPPKWKAAPATARTPSRPGGGVSGLLGGL